MLQAVFGFRGQLGRLAFLGWMAVATILVLVVSMLFLAAGAVLAGILPADGGAPRVLGMSMAVAAFVIGVWSTLALHAKRLRDMGFGPLKWMIGVTALMAADQWLLTQVTDLRFFPPLSQYTPLGGLVGAAYLMMLLLWPSADASAAIPGPPRKDPAPEPSSTRPMIPSQVRPQFGLRSRA
jgi:uncharacterized membrane protein YhaH (DUF805 family)